MTTRRPTPLPDDSALIPRLEAAAADARALFARMLEASDSAAGALAREDATAFAEAVESREPVRAQLDPILRALAAARASCSPADLARYEALLDPVQAIAAQAMAADQRLADLATQHRNVIGAQLEGLGQGSSTLAAYSLVTPAARTLDLVR